MNHNYEQALKKLMAGNSYRYRGCLIVIEGDAFYWANKKYCAKSEVERAIDRSYKVIRNSLINPPKPSLWRRFRFWLLGK